MSWKTFRIKSDYNGRFSEKRRKQYRNTKYWNLILNNGKIEKSKLFLLEIEDEINLKIEIENMVYFLKSDNIFDSVVELRKKLELNNIYLLCNASAINVYPSLMQKEFGGTKTYKLQMGKQATLNDVVDIFDYDNELKIGSVKEQEKFYESWVESF